MGIILDPTQVGALEHEMFQQLIQDLYNEICRRGLNTPMQDMQDPVGGANLVAPGQQIPAPSPTAIAYRKMGYNAALAGVSPALDEPLECFQGWVVGLNRKIADSYQDRKTDYKGSEPVTPNSPPPNNDSLTPTTNPNITDPTSGERADYARDADKREQVGKSDDETVPHQGDFEPETEKLAPGN